MNRVNANIPQRENKGILHLNWHFYTWSQNTYDYKLIVICLFEFNNDVKKTSRFINQVNDYLLPGHKRIFDGTIRCLKFLLDNKMLKIKSIPDENLRLSLQRFADDPFTPIDTPISHNGKSFQANLCKAVVISIHLLNDKMLIDPSCTNLIRHFEKATIEDLMDPKSKEISTLNSLWVALMGSKPWNQDACLNVSEFIMNEVFLSLSMGTGLNYVFKYLQPFVDSIAPKYIPEFTDSHPARVSIRHASIIVFFNSLNSKPSKVKYNRSIKIEGDLDDFAEDVAFCAFTPKMKIKKWFKRYYKAELEKRIKLIASTAHQSDANKKDDVSCYFYFPVYEYFRFINANHLHKLHDYLKVFKDSSFCFAEKDEIAKHLVFSIQNAVINLMSDDNIDYGQQSWMIKESKELHQIKEALENFIIAVIEPIKFSSLKKLNRLVAIRKHKGETDQDVFQMYYTEAIIALLEFDETINSSLFAYLKKIILYRLTTALRLKKFEGDLLPIADDYDVGEETFSEIDAKIDKPRIKNAIDAALQQLTPKKKAVIEKAFMNNESLSDSERRLKNRALEELRATNPDLKEHL